MLRYRDRATPLNWTMTASASWATSTTKQTEFVNFSQRDLTNDDSSFCSRIFFYQLTCIVMFFLLKSFCSMSVFVCKGHFWWREIWRHLHVTMLKCWTKFSNALIHRRITMIYANNYETVFKFVKVMPRILAASFFPGHGVYISLCCHLQQNVINKYKWADFEFVRACHSTMTLQHRTTWQKQLLSLQPEPLTLSVFTKTIFTDYAYHHVRWYKIVYPRHICCPSRNVTDSTTDRWIQYFSEVQGYRPTFVIR